VCFMHCRLWNVCHSICGAGCGKRRGVALLRMVPFMMSVEALARIVVAGGGGGGVLEVASS